MNTELWLVYSFTLTKFVNKPVSRSILNLSRCPLAGTAHVQQPGQPGTNQAYPRPPMGMPNSNPYGMGGAGPRGPSPGLYRYPQAPGYQ